MTKKILIATKAPFAVDANDEARRIVKEAGLDFQILTKHDMGKLAEDEEMRQALRDASALIIRSDVVTQEIVDAAPALELIVRGGAGYDNVKCMDYCTDRGITVMNTPGQNSNAVAELAMFLAGNLVRYPFMLDQETKEGAFPKGRYKGTELRGKKLGLHGFGYIGQLVAEIANGFGMKVFAYDPYVSPAKAKDKGVELVHRVEEIYDKAFMVSLHIPKLKDTTGIVNMELLNLMRKDGLLINTARAEVIKEDDLFEFMVQNKSFKYGADVHYGGDKENIVDGERHKRRFADFNERAILTPHIGADTEEANFNCVTAAAIQSVEFFTKGNMTFAVNKQVVPPWMKEYAGLAEVIGNILSEMNQGQPTEVKLVPYGDLHQYKVPLAGNALKGVYQDRTLKPNEALQRAETNNIRVTYIDPDNTKGRGDSVTIDYLTGTNGSTRAESIRGTIREGEPEISRIGEFLNVNYSVPKEGVVVIFEYKDRAGVIGNIGRYFADAGISIDEGTIKRNKEKTDAVWIFNVESRHEDMARQLADTIRGEVQGVYKAVAVRID